MVGIKDVAKHAGVSVATVSRALNEPKKVSEQTRSIVHESVKILNYHPNILARDFRKSKTSRIIVLVPDISNTFFASVVRSIQHKAKTFGYSVLLGETRNSPAVEQEYASMVLSRQADGIIQFSPSDPYAALRGHNGASSLIWVNACECTPKLNSPKIKINNAEAMKLIADEVLKMGHTKICAILGPQTSPLTSERLKGLHQSLTEHGLDKKNLECFDGDFSAHSGTLAAEKILSLSRLPTAALCFNDEMAFGLISKLKTSGLLVPKDISVTGFDDINLAKYCDPPLTTISQPAADIGTTAMTALHRQINKSSDDNTLHILEGELVIRDSIASPTT